MTPQDTLTWLRGFASAIGPSTPTAEQWGAILAKLQEPMQIPAPAPCNPLPSIFDQAKKDADAKRRSQQLQRDIWCGPHILRSEPVYAANGHTQVSPAQDRVEAYALAEKVLDEGKARRANSVYQPPQVFGVVK